MRTETASYCDMNWFNWRDIVRVGSKVGRFEGSNRLQIVYSVWRDSILIRPEKKTSREVFLVPISQKKK